MFVPSDSSRGCPKRPLRLCVDDLNAQLAPLESYALAGFSLAVADGLIALFSAGKKAVRIAGRCAENCYSS